MELHQYRNGYPRLYTHKRLGHVVLANSDTFGTLLETAVPLADCPVRIGDYTEWDSFADSGEWELTPRALAAWPSLLGARRVEAER